MMHINGKEKRSDTEATLSGNERGAKINENKKKKTEKMQIIIGTSR